MFEQFLVKYWTTDGKLAGMQVSAMSPIEAQNVVRSFPNFQSFANYPEKV